MSHWRSTEPPGGRARDSETSRGDIPKLSSRRFVERLSQLVQYDPETGLFSRRHVHIRRKDGYATIKIDGINFAAHRIAWLVSYGSWPSGHIDHIDRNPSNNALSNLRDVTRSQNMKNRVARGFFHCAKHNRYRAQIVVDGRKIMLGSFPTEDLARATYEAAARKYFGEFCRIELRDGK